MIKGSFGASTPVVSAIVLGVALSALAGCDEEPAKKGATAAATVTAASSAAVVPASTAATTAAAVAPSAAPAARVMPPRPVPLGSSGPIQPSAPAEQQMMAIQYTIAMVSPQPTDPLVDKGYVEDIVKKLEVAARTADKGKTPPSPVKATKGNRKLEIELGKGCTDKTPANLIAQRSGSSLKAAFDAGVLVVMCHDDKWECHQSTRDPGDVLCLAAPRH
jgi:hypothetical protein